MTSELERVRREADEYARESEARRLEIIRLSAALRTAREVEQGLIEKSAARGAAVEQLRARVAELAERVVDLGDALVEAHEQHRTESVQLRARVAELERDQADLEQLGEMSDQLDAAEAELEQLRASR